MNANERFMGIPNEIIAITGDIASGKTTRCKELESQGKKVIYQDKLVRQCWETNFMKLWLIGEKARYESYVSVMEFTPDELKKDIDYDPYISDVIDDMEIDYAALRKWVFSDPERLRSVEHQMQYVFETMFYKEYIRLELNIPEAIVNLGGFLSWEDVYYESATIYSKNLQHKFDDVEHLSAPEEIRVKRIIERDGCSEETARMMIKLQQEQKGN